MKMISNIILFIGYALCSGFGLVILKTAMNTKFIKDLNYIETFFQVRFILGFLLYASGFLLWMVILSKYKLNIAFPIAISLFFIVLGARISYDFQYLLDNALSATCAPRIFDPYCLGGVFELVFYLFSVIIGFVFLIFGIVLAIKIIQWSRIANTPQSDDVKIERTSYKPKSKKEETSAFCENCGNELKPTTKFCGSCGNQV